TGATLGKLMGVKQAMKGGVGSASTQLDNGLIAGALVAVNAVGDVILPQTGEILAGTRRPGGGFADSMHLIEQRLGQTFPDITRANTVLAVVATNGRLTKAEATKVARMAHDGLARTIRPSHTSFDGDTIFALSVGHETVDAGLV